MTLPDNSRARPGVQERRGARSMLSSGSLGGGSGRWTDAGERAGGRPRGRYGQLRASWARFWRCKRAESGRGAVRTSRSPTSPAALAPPASFARRECSARGWHSVLQGMPSRHPTRSFTPLSFTLSPSAASRTAQRSLQQCRTRYCVEHCVVFQHGRDRSASLRLRSALSLSRAPLSVAHPSPERSVQQCGPSRGR